jgi:hypothetical protein
MVNIESFSIREYYQSNTDICTNMWLAYHLFNCVCGKTDAGALPRDYILARY